jgi:hypothetical protein
LDFRYWKDIAKRNIPVQEKYAAIELRNCKKRARTPLNFRRMISLWVLAKLYLLRAVLRMFFIALCPSSARWTFSTGKILQIATIPVREKYAAVELKISWSIEEGSKGTA